MVQRLALFGDGLWLDSDAHSFIKCEGIRGSYWSMNYDGDLLDITVWQQQIVSMVWENVEGQGKNNNFL